MPATPGTAAWPPSLPSVPTSRATRVTSEANADSCSTIVLMVSLSCRISPFTSTVILRFRSPRAMAVATSAMLRTWPVRFDAIELTLSVRSFHVPATPGTCAWPPSLPSVPTSRATRLTSAANALQLVHHRVDGFLQLEDLAADVHRDLLGQVAVGHGHRHLGDVAHLRGEVVGHRVDVVGEVLPRAGHAGHRRLATELAFGADLARHAAHFAGERVQLVHHRVDGVLQLEDFAAHLDRDLLGEVAAGHGRRHLGDVAHLAGEVRRHEVDVVGEVLPRAGHTRHLRLATELAFGADLARHARHFRGEPVQLVHHRVDGVLQLEDLAASRPP